MALNPINLFLISFWKPSATLMVKIITLTPKTIPSIDIKKQMKRKF